MSTKFKCKNEFQVIVGGKESDKKLNVNLYEVGSRLIYNKNDFNFLGNWFVEEIKGKKVKIRKLALDSIIKVYNVSYLNNLISERIIEVKGNLGEPKSITESCKKDILNLKIFTAKGVEGVEQVLSWGAERCDWKVICNQAFVDEDKFEKFMKILEGI